MLLSPELCVNYHYKLASFFEASSIAGVGGLLTGLGRDMLVATKV